MSDRHPLDPLDADEITRAVALARTAPGLSARVRVIFVEAREPAKADCHAWRSDRTPVAREAKGPIFPASSRALRPSRESAALGPRA